MSRRLLFAAALLAIFACASVTNAADAQQYNKGKTVRIVVGFAAGGCWTWKSIKTTWRQGLESGNVNVVIQVNPQRLPGLPNVPNALEHAKTEEGREIIRAGILNSAAILRVYALPPATPKDRVELLRAAFLATMKDPEFVAEMNKATLSINPLSGAEVEKIAQSFFKLQPKEVSRLKEILLPGK